jgi:hypothetical protein
MRSRKDSKVQLPSEIKRNELDSKIIELHTNAKGTYGQPRISLDLVEAGIHVDKKTLPSK